MAANDHRKPGIMRKLWVCVYKVPDPFSDSDVKSRGARLQGTGRIQGTLRYMYVFYVKFTALCRDIT